MHTAKRNIPNFPFYVFKKSWREFEMNSRCEEFLKGVLSQVCDLKLHRAINQVDFYIDLPTRLKIKSILSVYLQLIREELGLR